MKKKTIIIVAVIVVIIALGGISMMSDTSRATSVNSATVERQNLTEKVSASGRIQPQTKVDITAEVSAEDRHLRQRQALVRRLRGRLAAIRCSAELLDTYVDITPTRRSDLISLITKESQELSDLVKRTIDEERHQGTSRWPLVPMMYSSPRCTNRLDHHCPSRLARRRQVRPRSCEQSTVVRRFLVPGPNQSWDAT